MTKKLLNGLKAIFSMLVLTLIVSGIGANAQVAFKVGDKVMVNSASGANLRNDTCGLIMALPNKTMATVTAVDNKKCTIDKVEYTLVKIKTDAGKEGYMVSTLISMQSTTTSSSKATVTTRTGASNSFLVVGIFALFASSAVIFSLKKVSNK
jgi:hypothetical protein